MFEDADLIHRYTRAAALEDCTRVDVTETAKEASFRIPVALTRTAWSDCVAWTDEDNERVCYQDEPGRVRKALGCGLDGNHRGTSKHRGESPGVSGSAGSEREPDRTARIGDIGARHRARRSGRGRHHDRFRRGLLARPAYAPEPDRPERVCWPCCMR